MLLRLTDSLDHVHYYSGKNRLFEDGADAAAPRLTVIRILRSSCCGHYATDATRPPWPFQVPLPHQQRRPTSTTYTTRNSLAWMAHFPSRFVHRKCVM